MTRREVPMEIDRETLESLRSLTPREAWEKVRRAIYQSPGGAASEDFQAALEQLVADGILSWDEIDKFEES
jgi:hypothetical protein